MKNVLLIDENKRYPTKNVFETRNIRTTHFGLESLAHLGPKIWNILPTYLKDIKTLFQFKKKIKLWVPDNCPCKLCKDYLQGIGYIN